MSGGAIDRRKSAVRFAEDQVEVCAGEKDGFDAIAPAKSVGDFPQLRFIGGGDQPEASGERRQLTPSITMPSIAM
jgi:hypothetical protein